MTRQDSEVEGGCDEQKIDNDLVISVIVLLQLHVVVGLNPMQLLFSQSELFMGRPTRRTTWTSKSFIFLSVPQIRLLPIQSNAGRPGGCDWEGQRRKAAIAGLLSSRSFISSHLNIIAWRRRRRGLKTAIVAAASQFKAF